MSDLPAIAQHSLKSVLEDFAFMFCEEVDPLEVDLPEGAFFKASITFRGPRAGALALFATIDFCRQVHANILGMDPEDDDASEASESDAIKELLNVTCGQFLEELSGPDALYDLGVPAIETLSREQVREAAESLEMVCLIVEDHPVILSAVSEDHE